MWSRKSLMRLHKLSNSGDALKLLVPNNNRKIVSGWINYSWMVISKKIIGTWLIKSVVSIVVYGSKKFYTTIGNRGSKSDFRTKSVKEQRVCGSWQEKWGSNTLNYLGCRFSCLRCILMGFERNYQVRILSKQRNIQIRGFYSYKAVQQTFVEKGNNSLTSSGKMNPWFLTGFVDGEGCFLISINRNKELKIGWSVQLGFQIGLHHKDKALLEQIKNYFDVGSITKQGSQSIQYRVSSVKDLAVIVNHFEKYPLITEKKCDFLLFKQVFNFVLNKEHLTKEGICKIVAIKASLNLGLLPELKEDFPNIVPMKRPLVLDKKIPGPFWLAGFSSAEGCFYINLHKVSDRK